MSRTAVMRAGRLALLVFLLSPLRSHAQPLSTTGRWVSEFVFKDPAEPADSAEVAIHLAVLRGRSDSTQVFYFTHGDQTRLMLDALAGSTAKHVDIPYRAKCASDYFESFCGGHATLADGRLFVAGVRMERKLIVL